jgi:hypothetical protein
MTERTGQPGQDNGDGTTVAEQLGYVCHLGQDHSDRTFGTGLPRQVSLDR